MTRTLKLLLKHVIAFEVNGRNFIVDIKSADPHFAKIQNIEGYAVLRLTSMQVYKILFIREVK